jgi:hypothetical protein
MQKDLKNQKGNVMSFTNDWTPQERTAAEKHAETLLGAAPNEGPQEAEYTGDGTRQDLAVVARGTKSPADAGRYVPRDAGVGGGDTNG